jgi:hypothetical protein
MTPSAFLDGLRARELTLSLDGDHLRLAGPPEAVTDKVRAFVREHKPQLVELLRERVSRADVAETFAPSGGRSEALFGIERHEWTRPELALIEWFGTWAPPAQPFALSDGVLVRDPVIFAEALRRDIASGPGGGRARTGALQDDLNRLLELFG